MDLGIHVADANARIVPAIEPAVGMVPLGIVKPAPRLAVLAGSPRFPRKQMGRPSGVMGLQMQPVVRGSRSQLQQPLRQYVRADERAGTNVRLPEAVDRYEQPTGISLLLGKFTGARIGLARLKRFKSFGRE